ncbi:MAG: hypothetical protein COT74_06920 [Bdellovibrionales bacterium CG10_big_fil_rev_8_21_14_0_10_45_34]|nr:MAG: hypothetical protein COT74_06920 [Bdellovibrionales bacterium CG10_big_fil_rev_8_21_14_0_10_45_34]
MRVILGKIAPSAGNGRFLVIAFVFFCITTLFKVIFSEAALKVQVPTHGPNIGNQVDKAVTYKLPLPLSLSSRGISLKELIDFSKSRSWQKIMHYHNHWLLGTRSRLDGNQFFFSEMGRTDPLAELVASLEAFLAESPRQVVGRFNQVPRCAMPARLRLLNNAFSLGIPRSECEKFDGFLRQFGELQILTVVFSSAYSGNPASMFGHTFLRIGSNRGDGLLDQGINFAANVPPDENPFAFMYFGLAGGYLGQWSNEPFYLKVGEYIRGEHRDLWEYQIALSPGEIRMLIEHLWEIETNSFFDYFFLDENCSYQILAAIEAVRPEWQLTSDRLYEIPGESMKSLTRQSGVVKGIVFRPSASRSLKQDWEALGKGQRDIFWRALRESSVEHIERRSAKDAAELAETVSFLISYLDYLGQGTDAKKATFRKDLLSLRASLPSTKKKNRNLYYDTADSEIFSDPSWTSEFSPPHIGDDPWRVLFAGGFRDHQYSSGPLSVVEVRTAYHDLASSDLGFSPYSQIEFPALKLIYELEAKNLQFEQARLLNIVALSPFWSLETPMSWRVFSRIENPKDFQCMNCTLLSNEATFGFASRFGVDRMVGYLLAGGRLDIGNSVRRGYRLGPSVDAGFIFRFSERFKLTFRQNFYAPFFWDRPHLTNDITEQMSIWTFDGILAFHLAHNNELRLSLETLRSIGLVDVYFNEVLFAWAHFFD